MEVYKKKSKHKTTFTKIRQNGGKVKEQKKGEKLLACVCVYFFEVTQANNVQQFFFRGLLLREKKRQIFLSLLTQQYRLL